MNQLAFNYSSHPDGIQAVPVQGQFYGDVQQQEQQAFAYPGQYQDGVNLQMQQPASGQLAAGARLMQQPQG